MKRYIHRFSLVAMALCCLSFTPSRPKVFVIGDSISIHYGPYLHKYLAKKFEYDRKCDKGEAMADLNIPVGANGGDSRMVLDYLKTLNADSEFSTDYLLINCGLHDVKTHRQTGKVQITTDEYRQNLDSIYQITKQMGVKLIWINSIPVNDSVHNAAQVGFYRYNRDAIRYNAIADSLFRSHNVPIIDLYRFSAKFPKEAYMDHAHYHPPYRELQAAFIAGFLENELSTNNKPEP